MHITWIELSVTKKITKQHVSVVHFSYNFIKAIPLCINISVLFPSYTTIYIKLPLSVILYWQHVSVALCDHHQANLTQCMPSMRVQYIVITTVCCDNELSSLRLLGVTPSRTNLPPTLLRYVMCSDREENVIDRMRITFTQYRNRFLIKK
jgi:hypothetical protein